jgi:hypothetical protein
MTTELHKSVKLHVLQKIFGDINKLSLNIISENSNLEAII